MKALILGATGATGKDLLQVLLEDQTYSQVEIFVRRDPDINHPKLRAHIIDFDKPQQWAHLVKGDVLFSCLGTTLKAAGSKDAQMKVDYQYQFEFARAAQENNVHTYVLVSASMASSKSVFFYAKMKGMLEDAVKRLGFPKLIIFNPPTLIRPNSDRKGELFATKFIAFLNSFGLFTSQKPLKTSTLACAMVNAVKTFDDGIFSLDSKEIIRPGK